MTKKQTVRIDGVEYDLGSGEYNARFDSAFFERNHALYESHMRKLRDSQEIPFRADANQTAFIARDLVFIRAQLERTVYERLRVPEFVPVEDGHPMGAESYEVRRVSEAGEAKITADLAGDSPRADTTLDGELRKYTNVRASYAYTVQDLEKAAFARVALQREKALSCADVIARGIEKIGRSGDAATGLGGFYNNTDVTVHTLTTGAWLTGTADTISADLAEIEQTLIDNSLDTIGPTANVRLVLPTTYEGRLSTLPRTSAAPMSVKEWFLANARLIKSIDRWQGLDAAVSPDIKASDAPQGICYVQDPLSLFWPFATHYDELPPQIKGWEWVHEARARLGGVDWRRPFEAIYVQNLD
jgi:hypothetical protein